jgi:hypothetical protein
MSITSISARRGEVSGPGPDLASEEELCARREKSLTEPTGTDAPTTRGADDRGARRPGDRTVLDDDRAVIAVVADCETAHAAVERLVADGVPADRISIVGRDLQSEDRVNGFISTRDLVGASTAAGAWVGGLLGLVTGIALLFLPGAGPFVVLGPLAAGAINAAEGALVGSGVGAVLGHFVHKRDLPRYEQLVRDGSYLVVVHGTEDDVARAQRVLAEVGARDVERHDTYRGPTDRIGPVDEPRERARRGRDRGGSS